MPRGADEGRYYPDTAAGSGGSTYNSAGRDPSSADFDIDSEAEFGFPSGGATSVLPPGGGDGFGTSPFEDGSGTATGRPAARLHGGADLGLLVLRLVVGGTFVVQGLRHLFGLLNGHGFHAFTDIVAGQGYQHASLLAYVGGGVELLAGALLVIGLFTPAAAAAVLAVLANVIVLKWKIGFYAPFGYELDLVLASGAFALLFAGPGRIALDRPTPWHRRPVLSGFIFLIIGGAVATVFLLVLRKH
jgi:putative oxidoreductase